NPAVARPAAPRGGAAAAGPRVGAGTGSSGNFAGHDVAGARPEGEVTWDAAWTPVARHVILFGCGCPANGRCPQRALRIGGGSFPIPETEDVRGRGCCIGANTLREGRLPWRSPPRRTGVPETPRRASARSHHAPGRRKLPRRRRPPPLLRQRPRDGRPRLL